MNDDKKSPKYKQTSLETANEMFKSAFLIKKARFAEQEPSLSETELNQKTANYFKNLSREEI